MVAFNPTDISQMFKINWRQQINSCIDWSCYFWIAMATSMIDGTICYTWYAISFCFILLEPNYGCWYLIISEMNTCIWVRSQNCGCLVTWFCYQDSDSFVTWPIWFYMMTSCSYKMFPTCCNVWVSVTSVLMWSEETCKQLGKSKQISCQSDHYRCYSGKHDLCCKQYWYNFPYYNSTHIVLCTYWWCRSFPKSRKIPYFSLDTWQNS